MKWVPVEFCQLCIENDSINAGKLLCYLKRETAGVSTINEAFRRSERYFGVSNRTIRRWMNDSQSLNWIGRYEDILFFRGWQHFFDEYWFRKKACYRFRKKDLKQFKTFCYAAIISYMAKRTQDQELERLKNSSHNGELNGRSNQVPVWVPMSASAIAKTLHVPESTARHFRNKAVELNYFKKKNDTRPLQLNITELKQFRNFSNETDSSLFIKDGIVYKQFPDKVNVKLQNIHAPKRYHLKQKFQHLGVL